jgi:hypothetical protein
VAEVDPKTGKTPGLLDELAAAVADLTTQVAALTEKQGQTDEKIARAEGLWERLFGTKPPAA